MDEMTYVEELECYLHLPSQPDLLGSGELRVGGDSKASRKARDRLWEGLAREEIRRYNHRYAFGEVRHESQETQENVRNTAENA